MKITRDNYMIYFLDYYEGGLSEGEQEELMRFLDDHADLKVEFFDFEMVQLSADKNLRYPDKLSLMKADGAAFDLDELDVSVQNIDTGNYELMFAAYIEGDLDATAMAAVEAFAASDPHYARELEMMQATRLAADPDVQYHGKRALKRHFIGAIHRRVVYYGSAAAAVLLLVTLIYGLFPLFDTQHYAEDIPVAGDREVPVAVVAPPVPQQEPAEDLTVPEGVDSLLPSQSVQPIGEPLNQRQLIAELPRAELHESPSVSPFAEGPFSLDLTAFRRPAMQPLDVRVMEPQAASSTLVRAEAFPANIQTRNEFMWLAYVDITELPVHDDAEPQAAAGGTREVSLAELAISRISDNTNLNLEGVEHVISGDRSSLVNIAGEGVARIAPATERILGIETVRNDEGKLVGFAIGDLFSISRR